MTDYLKWAWSRSHDIYFYILGPYHMSEMDEAMHFIFGTEIDDDEY